MNKDYDQAYKLYQKGRESYSANKMDEAIEYFKKSNELFPHFKTLELWGEAELNNRNYKKAITPLAAATGLNSSVKPPSLLSSVFLALKDKENAEKFAFIALDKDPNNKRAKNVLLKCKKI